MDSEVIPSAPAGFQREVEPVIRENIRGQTMGASYLCHPGIGRSYRFRWRGARTG